MSKKNSTNITKDFYNYKLLNNSSKSIGQKPFQKLVYFLGIFVLIFFLFIFIAIIVLLIRRQIHKFLEKLRRIKLQNEINKIMMIDIFETKSPNLESSKNDFHSIHNDSSLSDISSTSGSSNVLSEINIHNDGDSSKESI